MDRRFWKSDTGVQLARSVFGRLLSGRSPSGLPLEECDGRLDLRGITVPDSVALQGMAEAGEIPSARVKNLRFQDIALEDLDFSGADLRGIRFFDAAVRNCRFDNARFDGLRVWRTSVRSSSFRGAALVGASIGAWQEGKGNEYVDVDFTGADFSQIGCSAATFVNVDFSLAKLVKINFSASSFVRCTFAGSIREVVFWDLPPNSEKPTPNSMKDIDFTAAELHDVEFRGLRLDGVRLPTGNGHVIVRNYRHVLERGIERIKGVNAFGAVLAHELHWAHPQREVGIWHWDELGETDAEREAISALLRDLDAECATASTG